MTASRTGNRSVFSHFSVYFFSSKRVTFIREFTSPVMSVIHDFKKHTQAWRQSLREIISMVSREKCYVNPNKQKTSVLSVSSVCRTVRLPKDCENLGIFLHPTQLLNTNNINIQIIICRVVNSGILFPFPILPFCINIIPFRFFLPLRASVSFLLIIRDPISEI